MDDKNLEITDVQVDAIADTTPSIVEKVLPIAGGLAVGIGLGFLIDRFVVKPVAAKIKASKKAKTEPKPIEEKKAEE